MTSFFGGMFNNSDRELNRILDQAYQAALKIKDIEDEYFNGNKIPVDGNGGAVSSSLLSEFEKNLGTAQTKLSEFKSKYAGQGNLTSNQLVKLRFVDGILAKYGSKKNTSIVPLAGGGVGGNKGQISLSSKSQGTSKQSISQKSGILPRSIGNTFEKIKKDLDPNAEQEVLREFRRSRAKTQTAVRFIALLIIVPIAVHYISKMVLIQPLVSSIWESQQEAEKKVFLHYEMKEKALEELEGYEAELKFENMISPELKWTDEQIEEKVKEKADELAEEFQEESISALSNVFADLCAVIAFAVVLLVSKRQVVILKSFIDTLVYGLSDSAKAFIIIFSTDVFVGFHSPHGWDVIMEVMAEHLGVPANRTLISLFIATIPVFMDTMFKYWIFRYLSRMSPSTVATLKEMDD